IIRGKSGEDPGEPESAAMESVEEVQAETVEVPDEAGITAEEPPRAENDTQRLEDDDSEDLLGDDWVDEDGSS
ncbi:MAG: hypothetical protein ACPG7R_11540, partial [Planctomycetota bacterium]